MINLFYTNEFLKKLEPIIIKGDLAAIQKIKETLAMIADDECKVKDFVKLNNMVTKTGDDIFITEVELQRGLYNIFWTARDEQKIIITLTKDTK